MRKVDLHLPRKQWLGNPLQRDNEGFDDHTYRPQVPQFFEFCQTDLK